MLFIKVPDLKFEWDKDDVKLEDYVKEDEFKIVGITRNPVYLSKIYGNTELLTGELYGYITVSEEVFNMDYYSNVYIKLDIDSELNKSSFSIKILSWKSQPNNQT